MGIVDNVDSEQVADLLGAALAYVIDKAGGELILTSEEVAKAAATLKLSVSTSEALGVIRFAVKEIAITIDPPAGLVN